MQTLSDHLVAKNFVEEHQSRDEYREKLSKLGELAFDALLEDILCLNLSKGPDGFDYKKFIDIGFLHTSKSSSSIPEEIVHYFSS